MNAQRLMALAACSTLLTFTACQPATPPPPAPAPKAPAPAAVASSSGSIVSAEKTSYDAVARHLNPGGNLYGYLSTEQWLGNLSTKAAGWRDVLKALPGMTDGDKAELNLAFDCALRLIKNSGVEEVSGVGLSAIAIEPALYHSRFMVHHYPGQQKGFGWSVFGAKEHPLKSLDLVPANAGLAVFGDLDLPQLWRIIDDEARRVGKATQSPPITAEFHDQFLALTGSSWDRALASLGGEYGFVVTLDPNRKLPIPLPGSSEPMQLPDPGVLLFLKVKDDHLFTTWETKFMDSPQVIRVDEASLKMRTIPIPLPFPTPLRPTLALADGYLIFASSDALVREVIAVKAGTAPGLKSSAEFKHLSKHMPEQGNAFSFVSERFGKVVSELQMAGLKAAAANANGGDDFSAFARLFGAGEPGSSYFVAANTDEGWLTKGNATKEPAKLLALSTGGATVGLLAAIAIPNFVKARTTAQNNSCIANQRMLEGAVAQWALENRKRPTDKVDEKVLLDYLRGRVLPICPKGGTYIFTTAGENPRCSLPEHAQPH